MKRLVALALLGLVVFVGCSEGDTAAPTETTPTDTAPTDTPADATPGPAAE